MLTAALVGLAACGGKGKTEATGPEEGVVEDEEGSSAADPCAGGMCPPEKLEAIQNELNRKRGVATRCLTDAVDGGEADKNARGKVVVEFVVQRNGQARDVSVVKSSIKSQILETCIVDLVSKIQFPDIPQDLDWSYTFAFEAF
jgi:TonB family protein